MKRLPLKILILSTALCTLLILTFVYVIIARNAENSRFQDTEVENVTHINNLLTGLRQDIDEMGRHQNNYLILPNTADSLEFSTHFQTAVKSLQTLNIICPDSLINCSEITQLDTLFNKYQTLSTIFFQSMGLKGLSRNEILSRKEKGDLTRENFYRQLDKVSAFSQIRRQHIRSARIESEFSLYRKLGLGITALILLISYLIYQIYRKLNQKNRLQKRYQIFENAGDGLITIDNDFRINYVNQKTCTLLTKEKAELAGTTLWELIPALSERNLSEKFFQSQALHKNQFVEVYNKPGANWFRIGIYPFEKGLSLTIKDISELKKAETELEKSRKLYSFISKANDLILHAKTEEEIYPAICQLAIQSGDFLFCWAGKPDSAKEFIIPFYSAGEKSDYINGLIIAIADVPEGLGPSGRAFRTGKYYYCNDIAGDPIMQPWRDKALANGFRSSITLPIIVEQQVISIITFYAPEAFYFTPDQIGLLERVIENVSFTISAMESNLKRMEVETQLQFVNQAIEQSHASVIITNLQGEIQYINPAFTRLTGYTQEEVFSQNPRVLKSGYPSDEAYTHLWKEISAGRVWKGEFLNKKKNGDTYWESATISPIMNKEGRVTHYVAVKENITDRKKLEAAQQQLLGMFENTNAFMGTSDLHLNFIYANWSLREVLEIGNEDITQYNINDFRPGDGKKFMQEIYESLTLHGKWLGENEFVSKSGKLIPVMQVIMLHKDEPGIPGYLSTTAIDLTNMKEAEKELQRLNDELRNFTHHLQYIRETEKNTITKEIHDNLGQGLASLKMDAAWIKKHLHDDPAIIDTKMDELLQSISEKLAAFNKIYLSVNTSMIDEIGLMASVQYQADLFTKNYEIPVSLHSNMDHERIRTDQGLTIYRIVLEALSNIHQHAHATQVTLTLLLEEDKLHLTIQDNGKGFNYQAVDTQKHHGLIEIRERVLSMNGKLFINSQVDKGTTLTIEVKVNRK